MGNAKGTMRPALRGQITGPLLAWRNGDKEALERFIPLVYAELGRMAELEWAEYISRVQPWETEKYLETY